jgi:hypothetical protein
MRTGAGFGLPLRFLAERKIAPPVNTPDLLRDAS